MPFVVEGAGVCMSGGWGGGGVGSGNVSCSKPRCKAFTPDYYIH